MIVDERSAGFFALGAAQASGRAGGAALHLGHRRRQLPPGGLRGRRVRGCRCSSSPPTGRRSCAGSAPGRRSTRSSSTAPRCAGSAKSGPTRPTTTACSTTARSPAGRWPRRAASRGRARSTSTCPGASRWRRLPVEGAVTATDPLALEGRDGRPLTAVTRIDLEPSAFLLDEVAGHIGDAISGVIVAGRQLDPELREPLAHLAAASPASRSWPSRPRSCAAAPTTAPTSSPPTTCCCATSASPDAVVPDLVLRFGEMPTSKPLRAWLAASGADQIVIDPYGGWNEPTSRAAAILRADPTELASGWAARLEREPRRRRWLRPGGAPSAPRAGARRPSSTASGRHRAGPAPRPRRAPTRRRPRLHRLEHADPRPGGIPRRRRAPTPPSSATAAPTASTACLLGHRRRPGQRPADRRSSPATSACSTTSAAWLPSATSPPRSASSSSTTTAAASSTSCRRPRRSSGDRFEASSAPRAARRRRRKRSSASPTPGSLADCRPSLPPAGADRGRDRSLDPRRLSTAEHNVRPAPPRSPPRVDDALAGRPAARRSRLSRRAAAAAPRA